MMQPCCSSVLFDVMLEETLDAIFCDKNHVDQFKREPNHYRAVINQTMSIDNQPNINARRELDLLQRIGSSYVAVVWDYTKGL